MVESPAADENRLAAGAGAAVIRASDGDREAAAARLNQAAGDGRLTLQEFSERLDRAYAARTRAELAPLTACLPAIGPGSGPGRLRKVMLGIFWDSAGRAAAPSRMRSPRSRCWAMRSSTCAGRRPSRRRSLSVPAPCSTTST